MEASQTRTAAWTVARLLGWTREFFERHGVEAPRLCAEILLAHALGCERIQLFARFESEPSEAQLAAFRDAVKQAAAGRPIAYLTGTREFFSLAFEVTSDVLIPRPETEILVERTIDLVRRVGVESPAILDVGTGSGCIAVALAKHLPRAAVFASDLSPTALAVARRNAARHGLSDRIEFRAGDLFAPWQPNTRFDVLVSNPPYIAATTAAELPRNVREHEPQMALFGGDDGLLVIRRLVANAAHHVCSGGHLLMEIGYDQASAVRALLAGEKWADVVGFRDGAGIERAIQTRLRIVGAD